MLFFRTRRLAWFEAGGPNAGVVPESDDRGFELEIDSMRRCASLLASVIVLAMFMSSSMPSQARSAGDARPRFVVELAGDTESPGGSLTLDVTFYGTQPTGGKAEEALRHCLEAARVMHANNDIEAKAWFRASVDASDRQAIALGDGAEALVYVAKDKAVRKGGAGDAGSTGTADDTASVLQDSRVTDACQSVPEEQLSRLVGVGIAQRGKERKIILKAMRNWGKANDIASSRQLRGCMSAISKMVVALKSPATTISPEDMSAAIARGKEVFLGDSHCVNCHGGGGRGGRSGPNLSDSKWLHCDGSIDGIQKIILSGVPLNKLKDTSLTFPMRPATNLASDEQGLADLAAYVFSLSHP